MYGYDPEEEVSEVLVSEGAEEEPTQDEVEVQETFDFDNPEGEPEGEEVEATGDELNPDSPNFDPYKAFKKMHGEFTRKSQEVAELKKQVMTPEQLRELQEKAQRFDALATPQGRKALRSLISDDEEQQGPLPFMSVPNDPLASINPAEHVTEDSLPVFKKIVVDTVSERISPYVKRLEEKLSKVDQIEGFLVQLAQQQQTAQVSELAKQYGDDIAPIADQIDRMTKMGLSPQQAYFALRGEQLVTGKKKQAVQGKRQAMLVSPQIAGNSRKIERKPKDLLDFIEESAREQGYRPRV